MNRLYYLHKVKRELTKYRFRGKKRLLALLEALTPKMKDDIIVKTIYGFKLKISPVFDKGIERVLFNKGVYEEGTLWCFSKILKKGNSVIDAGANIGLTSIYAGKLIGNSGVVYAFEPMPKTYEILSYNIKLNKLKNIKAINCGLSDFKGTVKLFENLHVNRGAASLFSDRKENGIDVKITTLDTKVLEYKISNIDFIKIDIEGSEYPMLKGCKKLFARDKKPIICLEFSRDVKSDYDPELIYEFLKGTQKYRIFKQLKGKESKTPLIEICNESDLPKHDNLYCFMPNHIKQLPKDLFLNNLE